MSATLRNYGKYDESKRPVQNFPDYLKYVARKSKAGFDKVHEELYRIYLDSFSKAEKVPSGAENEQSKETLPSKIGLRKQWSASPSRMWSSSSVVKPMGNSFISYIPEENEDLGSSTRTEKNFDIFSDEYDALKRENKSQHNDGTYSASIFEKKRTVFNFDSARVSMPYSEMTKEVIYANDRVLHVEDFKRPRGEDEDNDSAIYSLPNINGQINHEENDYVNLNNLHEDNVGEEIFNANKDREDVVPRSPNTTKRPLKQTKANKLTKDTSRTNRQAKMKSTKEEINSKKSLQQIGRTKNLSEMSKPNGPLHNSANNENNVEESTEEEHDYLPPTEWKRDPTYDYPPSRIQANTNWKYVKQNVKHLINREQTNVNAESKSKDCQDFLEMEGLYDTPSALPKPVDPDYINVAMEIKIHATRERFEDKKCASKIGDNEGKRLENNGETITVDHQENGYDCPKGWKQSQCIEGYNQENIATDLHTEGLYTEIIKTRNVDYSEGDYSVPVFIAENAHSPEGDYSVPVWPPRPIHDIEIGKEQQSKSTGANYEINGANTKQTEENNDSEFYKYSVEEVVACLNECSIGQLAVLCKEKQLNGEHFRNLTQKDMKKEPYNMNWFHISRLFKVINGWRPKPQTSIKRR